ncbi:MAG: SURF1 family protein [Gammaproteobacteria bacterium]|nr:SURF1 family protein [Gammaproteobacteria bacterium]
MLTLLLVPLFSILGMWQLHRADDKRAFAATEARGTELTAIEVPTGPLPPLAPGQHLAIRGDFVARARFLVDNIARAGVPGYAVLDVFAPAGAATWLLVERGWSAAGGARDRLPLVADAPASARLVGVVRVPYRPGVVLGDERMEALDVGTWRALAVDPAAAARVLEHAIAPFVLALDTGSPAALAPLPPPPSPQPERHVAYAVQWFGFALALVFIYGFYGFSSAGSTDRE